MPGLKYAKYIRREPIGTFAGLHPQLTGIENFKVNGKQWGVGCRMGTTAVDKPFLMEKQAHTHPCDEFLCFFGGNAMKVRDFGAEIELYLGEELEKHVIDCATLVYVPKDLPHCPLNFKVIDQPIVFMAIILGNKYIKRPLTKKV